LTGFPIQKETSLLKEEVKSLLPGKNNISVKTASGKTFTAERAIVTVPPNVLASWLFQLDSTKFAHLTAEEHAVRSLVVLSNSPTDEKPGAGLYGPISLHEDSSYGIECLGPFVSADLSDETRALIEDSDLPSESYRTMHVLLSGCFVNFNQGEAEWKYEEKVKPIQNLFEKEFKEFLNQGALSGEEAVLTQDFDDNPEIFHCSSLKGDENLFDEMGFLNGYERIQVLGSSLLKKLRGVHPTLEILKESYLAMDRSCQRG